ncbi:uncharacterized protein N7459_005247 [Penicillium hispanicum]|uniref:uncharacterized protein n=1 Tax=Penicillium hispanicum TaxID=1080232 RepID=UPI002541B204|nr:uncharacterized protein N7459_005247 [Penicillium hispanicum]KAJ5585447.1 hypothetical protein N7459_005247 [Penicillium hispanicum]
MPTSSSLPPIYSILSLKEILVSPILWNSHHLDIVGCHFQEKDVPTDNSQGDCDAKRQDTERTSDEEFEYFQVERLARSPFVAEKHNTLVALLTHNGSPFEERQIYDDSGFHFARKIVHRPQYAVFSRREPSRQPIDSAPQPLIAYIEYSNVEYYRRERLRPREHPGGGYNAVGYGLYRKHLALATPKDWTKDPYLVCTLLALAQLQRNHVHLPPSRLLMTSDEDYDFIYLYEAQISHELLAMLDEPAAMGSARWPVIEWRKIAYRPYETFKQRLVDALLPPSNSVRSAIVEETNTQI